MSKKNKIKTAITTTGFCLVSVVCVTSVAISTANWNSLDNNLPKYYFMNKVFNNYSELSNYVETNYFDRVLPVENRDKWSITKNGKTLYFNDPKSLRDEVEKEIQKYSGKTSLKDLENIDLEEATPSILSKIYFNNPKTSTVYRGKNNSLHLTEIDAKRSYLSIHDAYYFNGMYFKNIEDLKLYLDTVYYVTPDSEGYQEFRNKTIAITNSSGYYSSPINHFDLVSNGNSKPSLNAKREFVNFIRDGVNPYIEVNNGSSKSYYSKDNFANLLSVFTEPDYTKIYSNGGLGTYVVDLSQEDENTLFGPYFLNATKEIELMTNTDNWKKVSNDDPLITKERDSVQISSFIGIILPEEVFSNNDSHKNQISPINIKSMNVELNSFFTEIKKFNETLFNNYVNFIETIKSGKNYNAFYSIVLSHSWLIDNLIKYKAGETLIIKTREIFNNIAKKIDENIKLLIPQNLLYSSKPAESNKTISFEEILDFKSKTKDFNTDLKYYVDEISYYSEFINAINIINLACTNAMSSGGIIPYNFNMLNKFLQSTKTYIENKDNILTLSNSASYEKLWNMFSSTKPNEFYENTVGKTAISQLQENQIRDLTMDLSTTSSIFNATYNSIFNKEKEELKFNSFLDEKSIFYGINPIMFGLICDNIQSINFEDFLWLKLIDKVLIEIDDYSSLENILSVPTISDAISLSKTTWNKIFESTSDPSNKMLKAIHAAFSLLEPAKTMVTSFKILDPIEWTLEALNFIKSGIPNFNTEKIYSNIRDVMSNIKGILDSKDMEFGDLLDSSSSFLRFVGKFGGPFMKMVPYVNIAFIALDVLSGAFLPKTSNYSYVFETNNVKYIWNGGQKTTMFWGLANISENTAKDMKLLKPQMVTSSTTRDSYYYNGRHYDNLDSLKKQQLLDIINGSYKLSDSSQIKIVYSFDEITTDQPLDNQLLNVFEVLGNENSCTTSNTNDLVNHVYNSVVDDLNNSKETGKYYKKIFIFANGHVASNPNQNKNILIDYVVDNIKPIKIAQLPIIINGKPNYDGYEMNEFSFPFNSWSATGEIKYNWTNNNYIIYDPNVNVAQNATIDEATIVANIESRFFESFEVDSKQIINDEIAITNNFTDLSSDINNVDLFVVRDSEQGDIEKIFFEKSQAMKYLLTQYEFTVYSTIKDIMQYKFKDNQVFNSKEELIDWAIKEGEIRYE